MIDKQVGQSAMLSAESERARRSYLAPPRPLVKRFKRCSDIIKDPQFGFCYKK